MQLISTKNLAVYCVLTLTSNA